MREALSGSRLRRSEGMLVAHRNPGRWTASNTEGTDVASGDMQDTNLEVVRRMIASGDEGDFSVLDEVWSPDIVVHFGATDLNGAAARQVMESADGRVLGAGRSPRNDAAARGTPRGLRIVRRRSPRAMAVQLRGSRLSRVAGDDPDRVGERGASDP